MENKKSGGILDVRDRVLDFVKLHGPALPVKTAKAVGVDITMAGAILSELIANNKIKVSTAKIGGSPVYYAPGQEPKLQMLESYLHGREKDAFKLLKEKRLIWEGDTEPWQRVALRDLKDFAVPINVIAEDGSNMHFWKWYLANEDEVKKIIPKYLEPSKPVVEVKQEIVKEELKQDVELKQMITERQEIKPSRQELLQDFVGEIETEPVKEIEAVKLKTGKKKIKVERVNSPDALEKYLLNKQITVLSKEIDKKGKEVDIVAYVPSEFGKIKFFIAFRNKKRVNEADLGMVFSKGQVRNMPVILLSNGELTKKAKEYLEKEFRSLTFCSI